MGSSWHVAVTGPVTNAWSWITSILSPAGLFLDTRHGKLIVSCVQTPAIADKPSGFEINDDMIVSASLDLYDSQSIGESGAVRLSFDSDSDVNIFGTPSVDGVATLPVIDDYTIDLGPVCDALTLALGVAARVTTGERTAIGIDLEHRVARYHTRRPERISLVLAGLAPLAAGIHRGSIVTVKTNRPLMSRLGDLRLGIPFMITRVAPSFKDAKTRISAVSLPGSENRHY